MLGCRAPTSASLAMWGTAAVIRNLEVIGEACNNVTKNHPDFAAQHANVPWGFAYEMRNALAHGYFNVDLAIVWQTIQNDLPALKLKVLALP